MESAIRLSHYPLASVPLRLSKDAARFHLRFNHSIGTPLSLTGFSNTRHIVAPSLRHVNCMLERRHGEGSDKKNKIMRGVTRVSLVLACVVGLFNFSSKMNPKFKTAFANGTGSRNFEMINEPQGKSALDSVFEMVHAKNTNDQNFSNFKKEPSDKQIRDLKLLVIGLSKKGKTKEASEKLKILKDAYSHACKNKHSAAEQGLGMALAELYLFQGNYKEALKELDYQIKLTDDEYPSNGATEQQCERLLGKYQDSNLLDKRRISHLLLYKAIVHAMLEGDISKAWPWMDAFKETFEK